MKRGILEGLRTTWTRIGAGIVVGLGIMPTASENGLKEYSEIDRK
jgi:hypothetical protein